ncbi:hypothetical protein CA13_24660 [Planctomycetes bacterium CA13]|uniref:Damage-control phosphatase ARMT1-like metal-binding domain-containing protein n=1 Tax=Novipirellula herctigrandis TaxID=2527986 RepID=A0A5C5Z148_9BACT|nr:hypothetical protein CA13_24660 [Planctomycetes bacterium CA13]
MNYECLICQMNALQKRMDKYEIAEEKRNGLVSELIQDIAAIDLDSSSSPEVTRSLLERLIINSNVADPYANEKQESNSELMGRYSEFKGMVNQAHDSFDAALRLAIAGNIIDFGPDHIWDIEETIDRVLSSDFAIDDSKQLRAEIASAKTILYLGDNCGEVVLDKLFIETINHPNLWFAVRNEPVLNDATEKEAIEVGIPKVAKLISNGDGAPSTLLHRVSKEFLEVYNSADLIVSKGMGNYEGLMNETDSRLFFLMMIKCQVIGRNVGAQTGDFVVKRCISN